MYYTLSALILARASIREDDLLVTVYSRERGKLRLVARGAKKILSKLAGHLEPVTLSCLNVIAGKNFDQLIGAVAMDYYAGVRGDFNKIQLAADFLALLDELNLEHHPDERIFNLSLKYLDFLNHNHYNAAMADLAAKFKLLALLGYNPAHKAGHNFKSEINFIVSRDLNSILKNNQIIKNKGKLKQILTKEINQTKNL